MNRTLSLFSFLLAIGLLSRLSLSSQAQINAVPNVIRFQGRVTTPDGNPAADGTYSIRFSLWDALAAGTEKWNQTVASVAVKNGTFAVSLSGFSATTFDGNLWLEIKIGTNTPLSPRQQIVSVPYALKSNLALTVPDNSITNAKLATGTLTADRFASGVLNSTAWLLGGNSGTNPATQFLGTTDNQPLVFRTNGLENLRIAEYGKIGIATTTPAGQLHIGRPDWNPVGQIFYVQASAPPGTQMLGAFWELQTATSGTLPQFNHGIHVQMIQNEGTTDNFATHTVHLNTIARKGQNSEAAGVFNFLRVENGSAPGYGHYAYDSVVRVDPNHPKPNAFTFEGVLDINGYPVGNRMTGILRAHNGAGGDVIIQAQGPAQWLRGLDFSQIHSDFGQAAVYMPNKTFKVMAADFVLEPGPGGGGPIFRMPHVGNPQMQIVLDVGGAGYQTLVNAWGAPSNPGICVGTTRTDGTAFQVGTGISLQNGLPANNGTTAFLVKGNGFVGIGTTDPQVMLHVTGNVAANNFIYTSDGRFKQNVATYANALDAVLALRGVTFDWKREEWKEKHFPIGKQIGFIAQEVEKVLPELVMTDSNGIKSVAYANIIPVAVEAIKAQQHQIDALRRENAALTKRLAEVEAKTAEQEAILKLLTERVNALEAGQKK